MKRISGHIRLLKFAGLVLFYIRELIYANFRIAHDVLTPRLRMRLGIVAVPLDLKKDISFISLANLITMTPGTLSIDISTDRKVLYIHTLYMGDPDEFRRKIKVEFESRIKEVFE